MKWFQIRFLARNYGKGKMHCINKNLVIGDIGTNEVPYKYVKPQYECDL